jgi:hypothetical protein
MSSYIAAKATTSEFVKYLKTLESSDSLSVIFGIINEMPKSERIYEIIDITRIWDKMSASFTNINADIWAEICCIINRWFEQDEINTRESNSLSICDFALKMFLHSIGETREDFIYFIKKFCCPLSIEIIIALMDGCQTLNPLTVKQVKSVWNDTVSKQIELGALSSETWDDIHEHIFTWQVYKRSRISNILEAIGDFANDKSF